MALILVVDDVEAMADQYAYDLRRVGSHETRTAGSGAEALRLIAEEPIECVILDLEMPGMDGFEVLDRLREMPSRVPVIVYTGTGDFERCARAIRAGAYSFIDKAESMARVAVEVQNALSSARLERENAALRDRLGESTLLGDSAAMKAVRAAIERLAPIPSPVLILGESGTGKELVATELHRQAFGRGKPLVAVNCGALSESLVDSELFGHEKGAFTGAIGTHRGAFEQADGGMLFLDEVGELPPATQVRLLRVLETGRITRLGAEKDRAVRARVVAATHRDLEEEVRAGRFREDLLYRINTHIVRVPPLRERRSDIASLALHFVAVISRRFGRRAPEVAPEVLERLAAADWQRNNVRELRNAVERMLILADDRIAVEHLPPDLAAPAAAGDAEAPGASFAERRADAERRIIAEALRRADGRVGQAAADLGLADHASLLKIMRRLGMQRD